MQFGINVLNNTITEPMLMIFTQWMDIRDSWPFKQVVNRYSAKHRLVLFEAVFIFQKYLVTYSWFGIIRSNKYFIIKFNS